MVQDWHNVKQEMHKRTEGKELELKNANIANNWRNMVSKIGREGPRTGKPGPKWKKIDMTDVHFKTTKEIQIERNKRSQRRTGSMDEKSEVFTVDSDNEDGVRRACEGKEAEITDSICCK